LNGCLLIKHSKVKSEGNITGAYVLRNCLSKPILTEKCICFRTKYSISLRIRSFITVYCCSVIFIEQTHVCVCKFSLSLRCLVTPVHLSHVLITCRLFTLHSSHSFYVQVLVSVLRDGSNYWNWRKFVRPSAAIIFTAVQVGTDVILLNPFCCLTVTSPFCNTFRRICVSPLHHFAGYSVLQPLFSHTNTSNSQIYPKQVGIFGD